ncbi:MAG: ABC transporter permease [Firmicutes bacterium]|nr:ABC transporter permease [Bacillota bacterium]
MMWWLIAQNTWRLAWRESLTRLELVMLGILGLLAAVAAVGSPTAGDGAIQMYAVAYATTPFALVLIIGQLNVRVTEEVAWWARPVGRDALFWGRFVGFSLIGLTFVGIMALWGWIMMTVIARLGAGFGALWTLWFALLTVPSVLTVAGAGLWLAAMARGARYFPFAIVGAVLLAFLEYKLPLVTRALPHLPFFNPFPGFLELGLALPPPLISSPWVGQWVWLNRLWWAIAGVALVQLAIRRRHPYYILTRRRLYRVLLVATAALLALLLVPLGTIASQLAPAAALSARTPLSATAVRALHCSVGEADLTVNAASGTFNARIQCAAAPAGRGAFTMNGGLRVISAREAGSPVAVHAGPWLAKTAERVWTLALRRTRGPLTLTLAGRLLPQPTIIPYPPFSVGQVYSGVYLGHHRLEIADLAAGLPSLLGPRATVTLAVRGLGQGPVITNARWDPRTRVWKGTLSRLVWTSGPMRPVYRRRTTVWVASGTGPNRRSLFLPYVGAFRLLRAWLPLPQRITIAPSPVTAETVWRAPILLYSTVHPYVEPLDPISGGASPPTSYTATLFLIHTLAESSEPAPSVVNTEVLAALAVFSQHPNNEALLLAEIHKGQVSAVGHLTLQERTAILARWNVWRTQPLAIRRQALDALWRAVTRKGGAVR